MVDAYRALNLEAFAWRTALVDPLTPAVAYKGNAGCALPLTGLANVLGGPYPYSVAENALV